MSREPVRLVRVDPHRLTAAMARAGVGWTHLVVTRELSVARLRRMRQGEPVPPASVAIAARRLGVDPAALLAEPETEAPQP